MFIDVDLSLFSLEATKKAAYRFLGLAVVTIERIDNTTLRVQFQPRPERDCATLADSFRDELLDQDLRERLRKETLPFQNLILAHAFSTLTTMPIANEIEPAVPSDDTV